MMSNTMSAIDEKIYRITPQSQIFILKDLGFTLIVLVPFIFLLVHFYHVDYYNDLLVAAKYLFLGFLVLELIPSSILHLQYYSHDKDISLRVDKLSRTISIDDKTSSHVIKFDEIESIRIVMTQELFDGANHGWFAHEVYHYAVLQTRKNERFIITCLLTNDLRKTFNGLGLIINWERRQWPSISRERAVSSDRW